MRKPITSVSFWRALAPACLAVCLGCGGQVAVEGTVNYDGQPLPEGTIIFEPADGRGGAVSASIEAGQYKGSGDATTTPGEKIVRVRAMRKTGRKVAAGPPAPPGTMVEQIETYVPAIYASRQSPLRCELVAGRTNRHDFELKSSK